MAQAVDFLGRELPVSDAKLREMVGQMMGDNSDMRKKVKAEEGPSTKRDEDKRHGESQARLKEVIKTLEKHFDTKGIEGEMDDLRRSIDAAVRAYESFARGKTKGDLRKRGDKAVETLSTAVESMGRALNKSSSKPLQATVDTRSLESALAGVGSQLASVGAGLSALDSSLKSYTAEMARVQASFEATVKARVELELDPDFKDKVEKATESALTGISIPTATVTVTDLKTTVTNVDFDGTWTVADAEVKVDSLKVTPTKVDIDAVADLGLAVKAHFAEAAKEIKDALAPVTVAGGGGKDDCCDKLIPILKRINSNIKKLADVSGKKGGKPPKAPPPPADAPGGRSWWSHYEKHTVESLESSDWGKRLSEWVKPKEDKKKSGGHSEAVHDPYQMKQFKLERAMQMLNALNMIAGKFRELANAVIGVDPAQSLTKGLVKDQAEYMRNLYQTLQITEGLTMENTRLQASWRDALRPVQAVKETGQDLTTIQTNYVRMIQRGIRDQRKALQVNTAALNIATATGMKAEETADWYATMAQEMGFSVNMMNDYSRSLLEVARLSGLHGDHLSRAVKNTEQMVRQMRNAGTLTQVAARNMAAMSAAAQREGVSEPVNRIMGALTSRHGMLNADPGIQRLLLMAADRGGVNQNAVMQGDVMNNPQALRGLVLGMERSVGGILQDTLGGFSSVEELMASALPEAEKMRRIQNANDVMMQTFGIGVGEYTRVLASMREASLTFVERFAKVQDNRITAETRLRELEGRRNNLNAIELLELQSLQERINKLKRDEMEMSLNQTMQMTSRFADLFGQSNNLNQSLTRAFANMRDQTGAWTADARQEFQRLGISLTRGDGSAKSDAELMQDMLRNNMAQLRTGLTNQGQNADAVFAELGLSDELVNQAMTSATGMQEFQRRLEQAQQRLRTETNRNSDPMTAVAHELNILNATLRQFTGNFMFKIMDDFKKLGVQVLAVVALIPSLVTGLYTLVYWSKLFTGYNKVAYGRGHKFLSMLAWLLRPMGALGNVVGWVVKAFVVGGAKFAQFMVWLARPIKYTAMMIGALGLAVAGLVKNAGKLGTVLAPLRAQMMVAGGVLREGLNGIYKSLKVGGAGFGPIFKSMWKDISRGFYRSFVYFRNDMIRVFRFLTGKLEVFFMAVGRRLDPMLKALGRLKMPSFKGGSFKFPSLKGLLDGVGALFTRVGKKLSEAYRWLANSKGISRIGGLFTWLGEKITGLGRAIAGSRLGRWANSAAGGIAMLGQKIADLARWIAGSRVGRAIGSFLGAIGTAARSIFNWVSKIIGPTLTGFGRAFGKINQMGPAFRTLGANMGGIFRASFNGFMGMLVQGTMLFKRLVEVGHGGLMKMLSNLGTMLGSFAGQFAAFFSKWVAFGKSITTFKLPSMFGAVKSAFAGVKSILGPLTGAFSRLLSILGPLTLVFGALQGGLEAGETGRSVPEAMFLGLLTGGAKTGSSMSGMFGVGKGTEGDEVLGVLGSSMTMALTLGALLGPVGLAIGGLVGAIAELYKIATDANSKLREPILQLWGKVKEAFKNIKEAAIEFGKALVPTFKEIFGDFMKTLFGMQEGADGFAAALGGDNIRNVLRDIGDWFLYVGEQAKVFAANFKDKFAGVIMSAWLFLKPAVEGIRMFFTGVIGAVRAGIDGNWDQVGTFVWQAIRGLLKAVVTALAVYLGIIQSQIYKLVGSGIRKLGEYVGGTLGKALDGLGAALEWFGHTAMNVYKLVQGLLSGDDVSDLKEQVKQGFKEMGKAVWKFLSNAGNLIGQGLAMLPAIIDNLLDKLEGSIGSQFVAPLRNLASLLKPVLTAIISIGQGIYDVVEGMVSGDSARWKAGLGKLLEGFLKVAVAYIAYQYGAIQAVILGFLGGLLKDLGDSIGGTIGQALSGLGGALQGFGDVVVGVYGAIMALISGDDISDELQAKILGGLEKVGVGLANMIAGVFGTLADILRNIPQFIENGLKNLGTRMGAEWVKPLERVWTVLKPLIHGIKLIAEGVQGIFQGILDGDVAGVFKSLGKLILGVFETYVMGAIVGIFYELPVLLIAVFGEWFAKLGKPFARMWAMIEPLVLGFEKLIGGFGTFIEGLAEWDFAKMGKGLLDFVQGAVLVAVYGIIDYFVGIPALIIAGIGGAVGDGLQMLGDMIGGSFGQLVKGLGQALSGLGDIIAGLLQLIAGLVTFDGKKIMGALDMLWEGVKSVFKGILNLVVGLVGSIWDGLKWVVTKLPGYLWEGFKIAIKYIVKGLLYAIIGVIGAIVGAIYYLGKAAIWVFKKLFSKDTWIALWGGIKDGFNAVIGFLTDGEMWMGVINWFLGIPGRILNGLMELGGVIGEAIAEVIDEVFGAGTMDSVAEWLGGVVNGIVGAFDYLAELPGKAWKWLSDTVNGIFDWFYKLWDWLVGHSIVPDMVYAIIDWFAKLPKRILKILTNFGKKVVSFIQGLWKTVLDGLFGEGTFDGIVDGIASALEMFSQLGDVLGDLFSGNISIGDALGKMGDILKPVTDWFRSLPGRILDGIDGALKGVVDGLFGEGTWQGFKDGFTAGWNGIVEWARSAWTGFLDAFKVGWETVSGWAKNLWDSMPSGESIMNAIRSVPDAISNAFNSVVNFFRNIGTWIGQNLNFGAIGETISNTVNGLVQRVQSGWNWLMAAPGRLWNGMKEMFFDFVAQARDFIEAPLGRLLNSIADFEVPGAAISLPTITTTRFNTRIFGEVDLPNGVGSRDVTIWNAFKPFDGVRNHGLSTGNTHQNARTQARRTAAAGNVNQWMEGLNLQINPQQMTETMNEIMRTRATGEGRRDWFTSETARLEREIADALRAGNEDHARGLAQRLWNLRQAFDNLGNSVDRVTDANAAMIERGRLVQGMRGRTDLTPAHQATLAAFRDALWEAGGERRGDYNAVVNNQPLTTAVLASMRPEEFLTPLTTALRDAADTAQRNALWTRQETELREKLARAVRENNKEEYDATMRQIMAGRTMMAQLDTLDRARRAYSSETDPGRKRDALIAGLNQMGSGNLTADSLRVLRHVYRDQGDGFVTQQRANGELARFGNDRVARRTQYEAATATMNTLRGNLDRARASGDANAIRQAEDALLAHMPHFANIDAMYRATENDVTDLGWSNWYARNGNDTERATHAPIAAAARQRVFARRGEYSASNDAASAAGFELYRNMSMRQFGEYSNANLTGIIHSDSEAGITAAHRRAYDAAMAELRAATTPEQVEAALEKIGIIDGAMRLTNRARAVGSQWNAADAATRDSLASSIMGQIPRSMMTAMLDRIAMAAMRQNIIDERIRTMTRDAASTSKNTAWDNRVAKSRDLEAALDANPGTVEAKRAAFGAMIDANRDFWEWHHTLAGIDARAAAPQPAAPTTNTNVPVVNPPSRAIGTDRVLESGLAYIHSDEAIVPAKTGGPFDVALWESVSRSFQLILGQIRTLVAAQMGGVPDSLSPTTGNLLAWLGLGMGGAEANPFGSLFGGDVTTPPANPRVTPGLLTEIGKSVYQIMMQEKAGDKPEQTEVHSEELTEIAENSEEQTMSLADIASTLHQIKMLLAQAQMAPEGSDESEPPSRLMGGVMGRGRLNTKWMSGRFEKGTAIRFIPKS